MGKIQGAAIVSIPAKKAKRTWIIIKNLRSLLQYSITMITYSKLSCADVKECYSDITGLSLLRDRYVRILKP